MGSQPRFLSPSFTRHSVQTAGAPAASHTLCWRTVFSGTLYNPPLRVWEPGLGAGGGPG